MDRGSDSGSDIVLNQEAKLLYLLQQLYLISLGIIFRVLIWLFFLMTCILKLFIGDLICLWYPLVALAKLLSQNWLF